MGVASVSSPVPGDVAKTPPEKPAIDISDVSLRFDTRDGPVQALANVDLKVVRGEFVSFIGPSAAARRRSCAPSPISRRRPAARSASTA